jgi:hypothetical protein
VKGHFHSYVVHKEGKYIVEKSREEDAGKYLCSISKESEKNESHDFDVFGESKLILLVLFLIFKLIWTENVVNNHA